ncbi:MAG: CpaE family protein [Dehalococcoidia bacterium]
MIEHDPPVTVDPAADGTAPPLQLLLAVGDPEHERQLIDGLSSAELTIAGRCLDAGALAELQRADHDVVLASTDLHRLSPAILLTIREAGLPLVLLADPDSLSRYRDLAYLLPLESSPADVRTAIVEAVGRGPVAQPREAAAPGRAASIGGTDGDLVGQVIALTGGKGAPGVTTMAVALADALAACGRRVLLVDADLRLGSIGTHLDLDPRHGLFTLAYGQRAAGDDWEPRLAEEVQDGPGFAILGGIERADLRSQIGPEVIVAALAAARRQYHDIVLDTGALIPGLTLPAVETALRLATRIVIVAVPDLPGLWHARSALQALRDLLGVDADRVGLLLNRRSGRTHYTAGEVERALGLPVHAVVADDRRAVRRALAAQLPLTQTGRRGAAAAVRQLAMRLAGEERAVNRRRSWSPLRWRVRA